MRIEKSSIEDLVAHMELYDKAIAYQHALGKVNWLGFEERTVLEEIRRGQQYKIVIDKQVACVFLLADSDPIIWEEKNKDPAIYIHRIATNPLFRGQNFVVKIIDFVKIIAKQKQKEFIRMDTTAGNERLNYYYEQCGFNIVATIALQGNTDMPAHYRNNSFTLFEMRV